MSGPTPEDSREWISFGPFVLHLRERVLTQDGRRVRLNSRALDLLIALLETPGEIRSKEDLLERIWRDRTVEEINLRVAVTTLRRSLASADTGVDYVVNSVGRGYAFSGNVQLTHWPPRQDAPVPVQEVRSPSAGQGRLPLLLKPVIGRSAATARIADLLGGNRLVTIVGTGGIGKTTVAVSTASQLAQEARFVDFAPGRDADLVLARIASALVSGPLVGDPLDAIIAAVGDRSLLLVLDNCEHLLDATANAASAIMQNLPSVRILATSRESLRVDGEVLYRLEGLEFPDEGFDGGAEEALACSAVQLLVERVQAVNPEFVLDDALAGPAAEICRRLDGIALAIQLAAGRVATFGLVEVAARLDDRFRFLSHGNRTALPRHQTLDAAISWSFELLSAKERMVCERLAIFSGEFTLDAAVDVAGWSPVAAQDVAGILADLIEKSLIVFVANATNPHYVFLETIRDFARARFRIFDTDNELFRRLANRLIADSASFLSRTLDADPLDATTFAKRLCDDIRYAVGRAQGMADGALLSGLVAGAAPLMFHLGAVFELRGWLEEALLHAPSDAERLPLLIHLSQALHWSQPDPAAQLALNGEAVHMAVALGDEPRELQARWGAAIAAYADRRPRECLAAIQAFQDAARRRGDRSAVLAAECLRACGLHDLGEFDAAMAICRDVLDDYAADQASTDAYRFGLNHRTIAMGVLGSALWHVDGAGASSDVLEAAVVEAAEHMPSLFVAMSHIACLNRIGTADWEGARAYCGDLSRRFGVNPRWRVWIGMLQAIVDVRLGGGAAFARFDPEVLAGDWTDLTNRSIWIVGPIVECCLIVGEGDLAASLVERLLAECRCKELFWLLPEALRLRALTVAAGSPSDAHAALVEARAVAVASGASARIAGIEATAASLGLDAMAG